MKWLSFICWKRLLLLLLLYLHALLLLLHNVDGHLAAPNMPWQEMVHRHFYKVIKERKFGSIRYIYNEVLGTVSN